MAVTHNGWPVDPVVAEITVNSVSTTVCAGDVQIVMQWVAEKWNDLLDPVALMRAYRSKAENDQLPNSIPNSNHISGTANDINWNLHPFGVAGTFTAAERQILKDLQNYSGGVIQFGEFFPEVYGSTVDACHVEIARGITPAQVNEFARKISAEISVPPEDDDDMRVIRRGTENGTAFGWDSQRYWSVLSQGTVNALVSADIPYKVVSTGAFDTIVALITADTSGQVPADVKAEIAAAIPVGSGASADSIARATRDLFASEPLK